MEETIDGWIPGPTFWILLGPGTSHPSSLPLVFFLFLLSQSMIEMEEEETPLSGHFLIDNEISRIMSLKDASKKMSKSEPSDFSRIILTDTADQIRAKIKKAKTADVPMPDTDQEVTKLKEVSNLINIYSSLSDTPRDKIINLYQGKNFSDFKNDLTDILIKNITPIGNEMGKLMNDQSYLVEILKQGSSKAYEKAKKTINEVYDIVGLIR